LWYREYAKIQGPNEGNELWQVTPTPDNGFAAAGSLFPAESGGTQDIWVFKTDSLGCLVPNCTGLGITEFNPNTGAQMIIYPNPFTNTFTINYFIPEENKKVYLPDRQTVFELKDIYGRLVYSTPLSMTINQLQIDASSLTAGVYVVSLIVDSVIISSEKIVKSEK